MSIHLAPLAHGGLVATHELHAQGFDRAAIAAAVRRGDLRRVRRGWYSSRDLAPLLARAARVGGVATCATALSTAGVWVLPDARLHVAVLPTACQLRSPDDARRRLADPDVVVHWTLTPQPSRIRRDLPEALLDYAACASGELVAATADSMIREHPRFVETWPHLREAFPGLLPPWLDLVDGVCESGTEFVFWARLPELRPRMRRQARIPGVGRVDFLIGDRLVVEINGFAHHGGREQFEADHARDAALSAAGFRVIRFSHRQVFDAWPVVLASLRAALARGDHY